MVTFGVLGPLVAHDARGPVDLKGPRHRAVLARLLIAGGRVVPVDRLVDDLWESPPDGAVGAIQTFVSALRRAIEPDRPPRAPAQLLVTSGPGYALHADDVDARHFEALVAAGRAEEALRLWRGPAYAEFADQGWARGEIARLDELRLLAVERRAEALLAAGRAAEAVPDLEAHLDGHPWREDAWRLLALALYRAGRQGDALAALRRARRLLVAELGVDPGPDLRQLESDILSHAPSLTPVAAGRRLVGRDDELAQLDAAGRSGLVLVSGEAGAGKTALAEAFVDRLAARGWTTAWGRNPEDEGLPAAWPWTQILTALAAGGAVPSPSTASDPVVARFHWHRAVCAFLADVARANLLLVFDDLHWAGAETLALLASVVTEVPVLVLATYRTTAPPPALTDFLGRAARVEPTRIYLGGLPEAAVPELVHATIGRAVDTGTAAEIHRRSGGNPFYVRELARLVDSGGALGAVPPGVRDVVRRRLAALPDETRTTLGRASVVGMDVDLDLLAGAQVLDDLESAARNGFLVELGPGRFRFAHALVRDTVYHDISRSRRAAWHAEVAERTSPDDVSALAHHLLLADSPRAAAVARVAAERAERRFAPHEAARLWRAALTAHRGAVRTRLELVMGLVRALAVTGALDRARAHRADAITLAEEVGDPVLTARVLAAFDVPAVWTDNDDPSLARRIVDVAERTLVELPADDIATRARLLATIAMELRNTGGARGRAAASESEAIARSVGDPALLAFALNARFMQSFERAGLAPERVRIGVELVELAGANELVKFEVLGHLILVQAYSALADLDAADRHAAAADRLGDDYQLPLVSVFTQWYQALRATIRDEPSATARYRKAAACLPGTGMSGLDNGILPFALLCHGLQRGQRPELDRFGAYEDWCRPGATVPPSPRDLLYEARTCLHAMVALERDDHATMARLYEELLPASNELAGAGSGLLTLRPVAHYLAELATALNRPTEAATHYRQAQNVATRANAPTG